MSSVREGGSKLLRIVADNRRTATLLALVCLLPIILYLPLLKEPLHNDEGFYAVVGRMLLRGDLPYRDAFDNKPPLVFVWYALSFLIFGENVWAPRLVVSFFLSLTTLAVYLEGRLLFSTRAAMVAALAFALSVGVVRLGSNANTEFFLVLPMTAGLVAYTAARRSESAGLYLLCGGLNGAAIVTKETALFPLIFLLAFEWLVPAIPRHRARNIVAMSAGAMLVGAIAVLPFVLAGISSDVWDSAIVYTIKYVLVGDVSLGARIFQTIRAPLPLAVVAGPWVLFSVLAVLRTRGQPEAAMQWMLVSWTGATAAGIAFAGRFYPHYYFQLMPGLSLLAPLGILYIREHWTRGRGTRIAWTTVTVASVLVSIAYAIPVYSKGSPAERHIARYPGDVVVKWETRSPALAAYIRDGTSPSDRIYNLGYQPEIYFYADRESPTRFLFNRPFSVDQGYVAEAVRDLEALPPVFIIDSTRDDPWGTDRYDSSPISAFIEANYDYVGMIEYADVYRLREVTPNSP